MFNLLFRLVTAPRSTPNSRNFLLTIFELNSIRMDHQAPTIEGVAGPAAEPLDFGVWTDHHIPQDRSGWHPLVR
jgi:hypothetical protein